MEVCKSWRNKLITWWQVIDLFWRQVIDLFYVVNYSTITVLAVLLLRRSSLLLDDHPPSLQRSWCSSHKSDLSLAPTNPFCKYDMLSPIVDLSIPRHLADLLPPHRSSDSHADLPLSPTNLIIWLRSTYVDLSLSPATSTTGCDRVKGFVNKEGKNSPSSTLIKSNPLRYIISLPL